MLKLYNTLTKRIEDFKPLKDGEVRAYFCGPTVQDVPHIGHARAFIAFDVLVRYLKFMGYKVYYIRNVTDIDDKIIKKANELGVTTFEIAETNYREFIFAMTKLKLLPPNIEPRATCHITEIIELIKRLIDRGYAYVAPNGDVYFDVTKFEKYGKLSGQSLEALKAGARIEPGEHKRNPLDFALWKAAKPGEPSWPSPWGPGRPGWHIECSAMSIKYLGETFDIHGGGADLIFPHHENEIAQSESATGKPFAKYWFHVGLVNFKGDKMSKSIGNVVLVNELLKIYDHETIRYWAISTHYRKPIEFSLRALDNAEKALDKIYQTIFELELLKESKESGTISDNVNEFIKWLEKSFKDAMNDDINTPKALSILHQATDKIKVMKGELNRDEIEKIIEKIRQLGWVLGILQQTFSERIEEKKKRKKEISSITPPNYPYRELENTKDLIELIVMVRSELRKMKMYDLADMIREKLRELGIKLEDTKDGTIWRIERI